MNFKFSYYKTPKTIPQSGRVKSDFEFNKSSYGNISVPPTEGKILEVYSDSHTADIELPNGLICKHVSILSKGWVTVDSDNVAHGIRDLPTINSVVLVLFIDGNINSPVILPFSLFEEFLSAEKDELLVSDKEREYFHKTDFGWSITYDKDTGTFTIEHPDSDPGGSGAIYITVNLDTSGEEYIEIEDMHHHIIRFDKDGFSITDGVNTGNVITSNSNGITLDDKNGNNISMESSKVTINSNFEVLQ